MPNVTPSEFIAMPTPISEQEPCGPSLEYDHEFAVLLARVVPRLDAQYGSFVGTPEAANWPDIERECKRLLLRSHDINLLVWLCRARTRLGQAQGLASALGTLSQVLHAWPEAVHPQIMLDGHAEPAVRANALAALADPEGLLADVCDIVVSASSAMRLTVRDVERAFAKPPSVDAMGQQSVTLQLAALRTAAARSTAVMPITSLASAAGHLAAIDAWARQQLGDDAPSLVALSRVLKPFAETAPPVLSDVEDQRFDASAYDIAEPADEGMASPARPAVADHCCKTAGEPSRADVLASMRQARTWFQRHEPSSPVAVLLQQAERLVGKRFAEVANCIPLDLLQRWDSDNHTEEAP